MSSSTTTTGTELSQEERNHDIWATRIQQELLSLTTTDSAIDGGLTSSAILPPFTTVTDHTLNLMTGTCTVTVQIDVASSSNKPVKSEGEGEVGTDEVVTPPSVVVIELDASFDRHTASYPFVAPIPRLKSFGSANTTNASTTTESTTSTTSQQGEGPTTADDTTTNEINVFPVGSTIQINDRIPMDLDWTPSLHLVDVIMNIGLKIRESILQKEPFHAASSDEDEEDPIAEVVADVTRGARRLASKLGSFGKAAFGGGGGGTPKNATTSTNKSRQTPPSQQQQQQQKEAAIPPNPEDVKIGDEINLLEDPWIGAHGVYSCKAIRRPHFVEQIMKDHNTDKETTSQFASPTAMFRSLTQTARSVMEESFLMVTETHIIELRTSKLNMQIGTVVFCISIELMAKLKFRRQESISLFFKNSPEDPLIYMCPDSGDAVHQIQSVLKRKGVRGKHTNAAAYRAINEALEMVQAIQVKETALQYEPTIERVNEIMDLYRQTAEKFESAGDIRHEEVVTHMRKFLAKPFTMSILDGTYTTSTSESSSVPPESVSTPSSSLSTTVASATTTVEDAMLVSPRTAAVADQKFAENIDNLLKEVKTDFHRDHINDDDDNDEYDANTSIPTVGDNKDFTTEDIDILAADLDAMMKEADKELAELMNS